MVSQEASDKLLIGIFQRIAGSEFDKDGTSLVKFQKELPPASAIPLILAVEIPITR